MVLPYAIEQGDVEASDELLPLVWVKKTKHEKVCNWNNSINVYLSLGLGLGLIWLNTES